METACEAEGEDVEDSSNTNPQLEQFREKWQAEIQHRNASPVPSADSARNSPLPQTTGNKAAQSIQERAEEMFMNGVWSEQNGLIYEAMEYYRKATKMVPDIDIQMTAKYRQSMVHNVTEATETDRKASANELGDGEEEGSLTDLCFRFESLCSEENQRRTMYCSVDKPQRATHLSALPGELLTYILRWVVSSDVDTRSLEQVSMVCRGFYVLARDPYIWQTICLNTWGVGLKSFHPYTSWRCMFIERPHLYAHGVYMNKVELYRQGEVTVEKFYPPWMKVVYYRYLRFFPDGLMFMHTSSSDPVTVISQLRNRNAQVDGMCRGMYRIKDNQVSCILKRVKRREKVYRHYKKNRNDDASDSEMTFYIDLSLHGYSALPNVILKWERYSVSLYHPSTENETVSDFALTKQDFPACKFARVKSYTAESSSPLEAVVD